MTFVKKRYQIKVFDNTNTYKTTISPKSVMSDISFTNAINGGQGELSILLNKEFTNDEFFESDLVKVRIFDKNNPDGRQIYFGWVSGIVRSQDTTRQTIELTCLGIASLMDTVILRDAGSSLFSRNQDPAQTIKDIVDYFETKHPGIISYSGGNIDTYGTTVTAEFDNTKCFEAIKNVGELTNFRRYVDPYGQVYFKAKPTTATHRLTNRKDVDNVQVNSDIETITNKIRLRRGPEPTQDNSGTYRGSLPGTGLYMTGNTSYSDGLEKRIMPRNSGKVGTTIDLGYITYDGSGDPVYNYLGLKNIVLSDGTTPVTDSDWNYGITNIIVYDSGIGKFKLMDTGEYEDTVSSALYGVREQYLENPNVGNLAGAQEYADSVFGDLGSPLKETTLSVNSFFDLVTIKPGDTVSVFNFEYQITNLHVKHVSFNGDVSTLTLERYRSFGDLVTKDNILTGI